MYYTAFSSDSYIQCKDNKFPRLIKSIPAESVIPLPPNPLLEEEAAGHLHPSQKDGQTMVLGEGMGRAGGWDSVPYTYRSAGRKGYRREDSYRPQYGPRDGPPLNDYFDTDGADYGPWIEPEYVYEVAHQRNRGRLPESRAERPKSASGTSGQESRKTLLIKHAMDSASRKPCKHRMLWPGWS